MSRADWQDRNYILTYYVTGFLFTSRTLSEDVHVHPCGRSLKHGWHNSAIRISILLRLPAIVLVEAKRSQVFETIRFQRIRYVFSNLGTFLVKVDPYTVYAHRNQTWRCIKTLTVLHVRDKWHMCFINLCFRPRSVGAVKQNRPIYSFKVLSRLHDLWPRPW